MVSDKMIHKAFRIHKNCKQNPLEIFFFFFTIYQNYTWALNYLEDIGENLFFYNITFLLVLLKLKIKWNNENWCMILW